MMDVCNLDPLITFIFYHIFNHCGVNPLHAKFPNLPQPRPTTCGTVGKTRV